MGRGTAARRRHHILRGELTRRNVVAHDIEHFVAAIVALAPAADDDEARRGVVLAAETVGLLCRELRGFAVVGDLRREPTRLVDAVERALCYARPRPRGWSSTVSSTPSGARR